MAAGISLQHETKLRQELALTPQLQAALELLAMTQVELEERIALEVEDNPMLAWVEPQSAPQDASRRTVQRVQGTDLARRSDFPEYDLTERLVAAEPSLREHLAWQVEIQPADPGIKAVALELLPRLTPEGWLPEGDSELAALTGASTAEVAAARRLLQDLEPPGIGARDLCECLLLQLSEIGEPEDCLAARVLREARAELEQGDLSAVARRLEVDEEDVAAALSVLRRLNPAPGHAYASEKAATIAPEVEIRPADDGTWLVEPLSPWSKRIRRSEVMERFEADPGQFSAAEQKFLREKLRDARWFLDTLKRRELTMLRVVEAIVRRQAAMLEEGPTAARPLTLREIADEVELTESTISRVTSQKFVATPHGQWSLRSFFRQAVGGDQTSDAVKRRIAALIGGESPQKPLSDQAIADMLEREGIAVARRTVAKYRAELGLGTAAERRRSV